MKAIRKQRLYLVIFIISVASVGVGLLTYALRENINLFYTPSQVMAGDAPEDARIRVGGMVVRGSVVRNAASLAVTFDVTDGAAQVPISYSGILPDMFAEGEAAVATGRWTATGVFAADEVLAKHDEEYMPPEVADAMLQAHERKAASSESDKSKLGEGKAAEKVMLVNPLNPPGSETSVGSTNSVPE